MEEIVVGCALEDACDSVTNAAIVRYTHFQGNSHARLDRVYISVELVPECDNYQVIPFHLATIVWCL